MLIDDVKTGRDNTKVVFIACSVIVAGQGSLGLGAGRCLMKISDLRLLAIGIAGIYEMKRRESVCE